VRLTAGTVLLLMCVALATGFVSGRAITENTWRARQATEDRRDREEALRRREQDSQEVWRWFQAFQLVCPEIMPIATSQTMNVIVDPDARQRRCIEALSAVLVKGRR